MSVRPFYRFCVTAATLALPLAGAHAAGAAPATHPEPQATTAATATTLYFDDSGSAEFKAAVEKAAQVWNASVRNVQLRPDGPADFDVVATDGWPMTESPSLGTGTISMGREAVREGFDETRIAAHEMGHILGLPDNRTGQCADLMSGHSAPTSCTNARPSPAEIAAVEQNFAGGSTEFAMHSRRSVDCFVIRARAS